jgi:hypothetical protein
MTRHERGGIRLEDGEGNLFDAVWSRSGKRLIVSVAPRGSWDGAGQVELTPAQLTSVRQFIDESIGGAPGEH